MYSYEGNLVYNYDVGYLNVVNQFLNVSVALFGFLNACNKLFVFGGVGLDTTLVYLFSVYIHERTHICYHNPKLYRLILE